MDTEDDVYDKNDEFLIGDELKEPIIEFVKERGQKGIPTLTSNIKEYLNEYHNIKVSKSTIWKKKKD